MPDPACRRRDAEAKAGGQREDDKYSEIADGEQHPDDRAAQPHH